MSGNTERGHPHGSPPAPRAGSRLAWLPVPLLLAALAVLGVLDLPGTFDPPYLVTALNFAFSTLVSVFVAWLAARGFLAGGRPGPLMLGCGVLVWGFASLVAAAASGRDPNTTITIHNLGAWTAALCHLLGGLGVLLPRQPVSNRRVWLAVAFGLALCVVAGTAHAVLGGLLPVFFHQGQGGTPVRDLVLGSAVGMFAFTAGLLTWASRHTGSRFAHWYAMALGLLASGLFGVMVQPSFGGAVGWLGRATQYLGGVYMLVATVIALRESGHGGISLEEALRDSEQRYRTLFDTIHEGVADHRILLDDQGRPHDYRFLSVNPAFERLTGLSREQVVGRTAREVLPGLEPTWLETYARVASTGEAAHLEAFAGPLGRWYEANAYPSGPGCFVVVFQDVTQRYEAAEALRAALARAEEGQRTLEALMEWVPEGITIADAPSGNVRMVSRYGQELVGGAHAGMTVEQVAAKWRVFQPDGVTPLADEDLPLNRALHKGETVREVEVVQSGERTSLNLTCNAAPLRAPDGTITGAVVTWRDTTERKRWERELRRNHQRLQAAYRAARAGTWEWDLRTGVQEWSPEVYDLCGVPPGTQEPSYGAWLGMVHPDDRERVDRASRDGVQRGVGTELEFRIRRPVDGRFLWILSIGSVLRDPAGQPESMVGFAMDITDRKTVEEDLRALTLTLEQRVAQRTAEAEHRASQLRQLAVRLSHAERMERERLARVLHDHFQQILVAAKVHVEVVLARLEDESLRKAASRVESLLDQAIGESRTLTTELSPPVLRDAGLSSALAWLAHRKQEQYGLEVQLDVVHDAEPADPDVRMLLFEAVRELLFNVVKHAGVLKARVGVDRVDGEVRIRVADEGRGIALQATGDGPEAPTGFGLFSIQQRLRLVGGEMVVEGGPGQGTRIELRAPLGRSPAFEGTPVPAVDGSAPATPGSGTSAARGDRIRVLLVDDHATVRQGFAALLQCEDDLEVVGEAADGRAAVAQALALRPDVIVMDISMPGMNGIDATREIVAALPAVRIVGLSMHEEGNLAEAMRQAGAVAFLTKGGPSDALIAALRKASRPRGS